MVKLSQSNMENIYLIEIRLVGRIKHDIVNLARTVCSKFKTDTHKIVPHITLVGPFQSTNESKLIKDFELVCNRTGFIVYAISGTSLFAKSGVIYLEVAPNDALETFRASLCAQLQSYCRLSYWDFQMPFRFHTTIASKVKDETIPGVFQYLNSCKPLTYDIPVLRVTLLKRGNTLCEYDFVLKRPLESWERQNFIQNQEYINKYYNSTKPEVPGKPRVFFTSDLHLNDKVILKQAFRPFSSVEAMNNTLISNWNAQISPYDTVYYLGDLAHKYASSEELDFWLSKLNGNIVFIKGDDDKNGTTLTTVFKEYEIKLGGERFFLVHSPEHIPDDVLEDPKLWTIHGHTQNNKLKEYPFINKEKRTINVSMDLTAFRPVPASEILRLMKSEQKTEEFIMPVRENPKTPLFRNQIASF